MATTSELHDENAWSWPCPYCRAVNSLDAATCSACRAQLRDPDEDDLFTTIATENAQVIDPGAPRMRESLWSTEVARDADVLDAEPASPRAPEPDPAPHLGGPSPMGTPAPGPFSARQRPAPPSEEPLPPRTDVFGSRPEPAAPPAAPAAAPPVTEPVIPAAPPPAAAFSDIGSGGGGASHVRPTPDQHGLGVAVETLPASTAEACAAPIAVCGALLRANEIVVGCVAGHLLGHAAVVVLTSERVIVANARRWKPLVDVFVPGPDLMVHTRHDRDIASLTFVQADRLTGVDDITDVAGALDMAERVRAMCAGQ